MLLQAKAFTKSTVCSSMQNQELYLSRHLPEAAKLNKEPAGASTTAATRIAATTNGGTFSNRGASSATENTGNGGGTASYDFVNSGGGGRNSRSYDQFGGYWYNGFYWWGSGYWGGGCFGCGLYTNTLGNYPSCPDCQYYDPSQAICVSTPACYGGSCPQCQYLDPSCQCCKTAAGCNGRRLLLGISAG
ncbi:g10668 [Coccomyxa elongata]